MSSFPVNTKTACPLKWVWSTLYLNSGVTRSCHRTAESVLSPDNFATFHNTPIKIQDRRQMLAGEWPTDNCGYCRDIESVGGVSDRMRQLTLPHRMPAELMHDPKAVEVSPTLVEVYFNNTCNLGCLYCSPKLSSTIAAENQRHGKFQQGNIILENPKMHFRDLVGEFWKWFPTGFVKLSRLHVLGGEPFYQTEFDTLLDMIDRYPNPDCELNVITNLMVDGSRIERFLDRFDNMVSSGKLRRVDITCSIDCWGREQEYVRWGLDLDQWQNNFQRLLARPDIYLNINQTISTLTIKTMPDLVRNLQTWRQQHQIGHWFSEVTPGPAYLKPHILGAEAFRDDFDDVLSLMPTDNDENRTARDYMASIFRRISQHEPDPVLIRDMFVYLNEKDRRRGTSWRQVFPWLEEFEKYVV
jgi:hypothetical protein